MNYSDCFPGPNFTLKVFILLKWTDQDGQIHSLRLRNVLMPYWCDMGLLLGISMSKLDELLVNRSGDVRQCCRDVLHDWIQNGSSDYPATWGGLINLLHDIEISSVARSLELALKPFQGE